MHGDKIVNIPPIKAIKNDARNNSSDFSLVYFDSALTDCIEENKTIKNRILKIIFLVII